MSLLNVKDYEEMTEEEQIEAGIYACACCGELFRWDDLTEMPDAAYCEDCYADIYG